MMESKTLEKELKVLKAEQKKIRRDEAQGRVQGSRQFQNR